MVLFNNQRSQDNHHIPSRAQCQYNYKFQILKPNISLIEEIIDTKNLKPQIHLFLYLEKFRFARRSMHKTNSPEISQ